MLKKALLYARTIRHLRAVQIYTRLKRLVWTPQGNIQGPALDAAVWAQPWTGGIIPPQSWFAPDQFIFLNDAGDLSDIGWRGPEKSHLWRYNQHYFYDLLSDLDGSRGQAHTDLILRWIAQNPADQGGVGWEPYPTSLRIINWVKWLQRPNTNLSSDPKTRIAASLAVQARWLLKNQEWHILGNHLFVNAKALIFAGAFFTGPEADRWMATGLNILKRQVPEQILADGGQFERSPMYHALAVEDMLDLLGLGLCAPDRFSQIGHDVLGTWGSIVPKMLQWLATMTHPDGQISFFNDAAFGIAPTLSQVNDFAQQLGYKAAAIDHDDLTVLADSGYMRLARGPAVVLADTAPIGPSYLPGHAHADSLSFEMSFAGQRCIVNGGTSSYGSDAERHRQRSTAAHATLTVDGQNSSEIWGGFRVARRAHPIDVAQNTKAQAVTVTGGHTGFRRLPGRPVHHRTWALSDSGLIVTDAVAGRKHHTCTLYFPLAPDWTVGADRKTVGLMRPGTPELHITVTSSAGLEWQVVETTWHPEFGISVPAQKLVLTLPAAQNILHETRFTWHQHP